MATLTQLRQDFLNGHLGMAVDGAALPFTTAQRDEFLRSALEQSWPDIGNRATSSVATNGATDSITLPGAFQQGDSIINRIEVMYAQGGITRRVAQITSWYYRDETTIRIVPALPTLSGLTVEVVGWLPFTNTGSDLPVRLEQAIAARAASLAFGDIAGQLANSERQQGLDVGQIVDYPTAVGLSAYWERRYFEQIEKDPAKVAQGVRRARR